VRADGWPENLLPTVRREVSSLDPGVALFEVLTLNDYISAAWFTQRIAATLLSTLGTLALLLAAIGLFSVMAYNVSQRTHEIGIRMALGAQAADVLRLIVGQGLRFALVGIAIGLATSFALTPLIRSQLLGVSATDPLTFVCVSVLLTSVAVLACWLPAQARPKSIDGGAKMRMIQMRNSECGCGMNNGPLTTDHGTMNDLKFAFRQLLKNPGFRRGRALAQPGYRR
jgi:hypothetical protein